MEHPQQSNPTRSRSRVARHATGNQHRVQQVEVTPLPAGRFEGIVPDACMHELAAALADTRERLDGNGLWHVNSTATGGGVAEMLQSVLGYVVGAGIETRWATVEGEEDFFVVTKRIHHMLHGKPGDGGALGDSEQRVYLESLAAETGALLEVVRPGDVIFLHDPQTLGLARPLRDAGARVVWTCHVGVDEPGETARAAWRFLLPHARCCDAQVFSRPQYVWEGLDATQVEIIPPCIDAFSPKNQLLEEGAVNAILERASIVAANGGVDGALFVRRDGEPGHVVTAARMLEDAPLPREAPVVTQVSRWDPLKDHSGVMRAFAEHVPSTVGAHLILAGPAPEAIEDDPEGGEVLDGLVDAWRRLAPERRERIHIASLPMADVDENAAIVNALQRHSSVIVQKSLAEGFGLTVAEAMWKARPVAASRVGGIQDQIEHGRTGLLVDDPRDGAGLGRALTELLENDDRATRLARAAYETVADRYLVPRYLSQQLRLVLRLDER